MTTILGIKTNFGEEGIILAADLKFDWHDGDDEERIFRKENASKIRRGPNYVFGFSGLADNHLECFFNYLLGKKTFNQFLTFISGGRNYSSKSKTASSTKEDPLSIAVKDKILYLESLNVLNRYHSRRYEGDTADCIELILALNKPKLQLYNVDSYGNVFPSRRPAGIEYVCCGSGSKEVQEYFDEQEYSRDPSISSLELNIDSITIPVALRLALAAMKKAAHDPGTGDLVDIVIVKNQVIESYEGMALKAIRDSYEQLIKKYY